MQLIDWALEVGRPCLPLPLDALAPADVREAALVLLSRVGDAGSLARLEAERLPRNLPVLENVGDLETLYCMAREPAIETRGGHLARAVFSITA